MEYSKELPSYTRGEERFSAITHIAGGGLAIAGFVVGLIIACITKSGFAIASMLVYGIALIIMYSMSSIYHFLHTNLAKKIFRIFEPITLPIAISFSPLIEATTEVASSGSDVPTATTVKPITASDKLSIFAK